jgi:hypothetical protein
MHLLRAEGVAHGNGTMLRIGCRAGGSDGPTFGTTAVRSRGHGRWRCFRWQSLERRTDFIDAKISGDECLSAYILSSVLEDSFLGGVAGITLLRLCRTT